MLPVSQKSLSFCLNFPLLVCPDPSYELNPANNFCYFVLPGSATAAEPDCQSHGAHAASVADQDESDWIIGMFYLWRSTTRLFFDHFSYF